MSRNKKTYLEWVAEYTDYVIIRLEGYFYTVKYEAAELISEICDYNLGFFNGIPITGSPDYTKMEEALIANCVNYIIIENDSIVAIREFSASDFKYQERQIINKEVFDDDNDMLLYLENILSSVDPDTGEIFDEYHIINSEKMHKILLIAEQAVKRKIKNKKNRPENAGSTWTEEENNQLRAEYADKISIDEIAKIHKRSKSAISSQLIKLSFETKD